MKIKEAIKIINSTKTVRASLEKEKIYFCEYTASKFDYFLVMPQKADKWDDVKEDFEALYSTTPKDLARVMDVIQRLLHTPVEERFPEKKYRLVANPNSIEQTGTYATKYVACIQDGMDCFSFVYGGPTVFSEKELKQIEELHPNIAPAIDTMKEEVKDNEAD